MEDDDVKIVHTYGRVQTLRVQQLAIILVLGSLLIVTPGNIMYVIPCHKCEM